MADHRSMGVRTSGIIGLLSLFIASTPAFAGIKAVYFDGQIDDADMDTDVQIEVADNGDIRASSGVGGEALQIGKASYAVFENLPGQIIVMRMGDLDDLFALLGSETRPDPTAPPLPAIQIEKLGLRQVNGRVGTAYRLKETKNGPWFAGFCGGTEFVTSDDPELAPIGRGLKLVIEMEIRRTTGAYAERELAQLRPILELGTLIACSTYTLTSVEKVADKKRFSLESRPLTPRAAYAKIAGH